MQPMGEDFTVTVDGEERTYYIEPNCFMEATVTRLVSYVRAKRSEQRKEVMRELGEAGKDLPIEVQTNMGRDLIRDAIDRAIIDYESALAALNSADGEGLAIALEMNVQGINSRAEARKVMAAYPNMAELTSKVVTAGMSAIHAAQEYDPKTGLGN
jgi:hypothetical protein